MNIEIIKDLLQNLRNGQELGTRVALSAALYEMDRITLLENEILQLKTRIMEEQMQRAHLEWMITTMQRQRISPAGDNVVIFDGRVAGNQSCA